MPPPVRNFKERKKEEEEEEEDRETKTTPNGLVIYLNCRKVEGEDEGDKITDARREVWEAEGLERKKKTQLASDESSD